MIKLPGGDSFETFYIEVEAIVKRHGIPYMDAVLKLSESRGIEVEYIATLVSSNKDLKLKIQREAEELHFLKKGKRVPI